MTKEQKIKFIVDLLKGSDLCYVDNLYEILINEDYDYIQNLMTKEEFEDFIEKWTPNKCSEGEN